jgi:uncharacterized membrane protein required for colicin V production
MNYFIDFVFVLVAVLVVVSFSKKGFIKAFFGFGKTIICVLTAYILGPKLSAWLFEKFFSEKINGKISDIFSSALEKSGTTVEELLQNIPEFLNKVIDIDSLTTRFGANSVATQDTVDQMSEAISNPIAVFLSNIAAYILVFVAAMVLLSILAFLLDKVFRLPVLNAINRLLGTALGVVVAFVDLCVLSYVVSFLLSVLSGKVADLSGDITNRTYIYKFFYNLDFFKLN